jgi:hypothetical protein
MIDFFFLKQKKVLRLDFDWVISYGLMTRNCCKVKEDSYLATFDLKNDKFLSKKIFDFMKQNKLCAAYCDHGQCYIWVNAIKLTDQVLNNSQ